MIGSAQVGGWIAHVAFWILLTLAAINERWKAIGVCGALWVVGYLAAAQLPTAGLLFRPYVAILDVALVFIVFRRDVRLM